MLPAGWKLAMAAQRLLDLEVEAQLGLFGSWKGLCALPG